MWGPENAEALIARTGHTWAVSPVSNGENGKTEKKEAVSDKVPVVSRKGVVSGKS
jgi:hypothetical protein